MCLLLACSLIFGVSCSSGTTTETPSDPLTVVENGESDYVIVVSEDADECEQFSAEELQSFISQSTGAVLPIVKDTSLRFNTRAKHISVGETKLLSEAEIAINSDELTLDGFKITARGNTVFICGPRSRATMYGVYEFLERFIGIRFLTDEVTHVPQTESLYITETNITEIPDIPLRSYWTPQLMSDPLYAARMRMVAMYGEEKPEYGYGVNKDFIGGGHNLEYLVPYSEYGSSHSEFFWRYSAGWDICLSVGLTETGELIDPNSLSPVTIVVEALKQQIQDNPETRYFAVCQMDSPTGCPCPTCTERSVAELGGRSGILIRFVNAVNRLLQPWVEENYPGREVNIVTFAYEYTKYAPLKDDGTPAVYPDDEITIYIAPSDANYAYSFRDDRQNSVHLTMIEGWRKVSNNFFFWDYNLNYTEYLFYFPGLSTFKDNYSLYKEMGVKYVFTQAGATTSDPRGWNTEIKCYIASKLMWDTSLDIEDLIDEFNTLYYGEYADVVDEVITLFEENFAVRGSDPNTRLYIMINGTGTNDALLYPVNMLERACTLLENAIEEADDIHKERLIRMLVTPQRMLLRNYNNYYLGNAAGEEELAKKFIANCELLGMEYLGDEAPSISEMKEQYGV